MNKNAFLKLFFSLLIMTMQFGCQREQVDPVKQEPGAASQKSLSAGKNATKNKGLTPLYRYFNPQLGDHFYTTNWNELGYGGQGYTYEGSIGYLYNYQYPGTIPLHRFYNPRTGDHFYTINPYEPAIYPSGYVYEGIPGYVFSSQTFSTVPLHRYWNTSSGDHFYTTSFIELGSGINDYTYEGNMGYIYPENNLAGYLGSLRRYYHPYIGYHFYTIDETPGWFLQPEGVTGKIFSQYRPGTIALYRYFKPSNGDYFYSTNWNEVRYTRYGYHYQRIAGYLFSSQQPGTIRLYRYFNPNNGLHFYTASWNEIGWGNHGYYYEGIAGYIYP